VLAAWLLPPVLLKDDRSGIFNNGRGLDFGEGRVPPVPASCIPFDDQELIADAGNA